MQSIRSKLVTRMAILLAVLTMVMVALLYPTVLAQEDFVSVIDIDDEFGDGYERQIKSNENTTYHWTLFNDGSMDLTYNVSISIKNSNPDWSAQLTPTTLVVLLPGETESVSLLVGAPNKEEGKTTVTVTFTIQTNENDIHREERKTLTSLQPIEKGKKILGIFDNPFPNTFMDNIWGIFVLNVVAWFLISVLIVFIMDPFIKALTKKTKTEVDDIILRIIRTPILVLVFFYGVVSSLRILENEIPEVLIDVLNSLYGVIAVLIIFYVAYKLFKDILVYYGELIAERTSSNIDNVVIPIVEKIGVVIIGLVALGYLLGYLNIDLSLFVAGGVVVSMVIAFAAQETLSNFFSGIFILTDRPFKEEDTIILPDGDWYEVRDIGLRSTRLFRYKDSCLITIPNNKLANEKIINYSNPYDKCRIRKTVGVAYGTDVEKTRKILEEIIYNNPHIVTDMEGLEPVIRFDELADSSINFFIQVIVDERENKLGVVDYLNSEIYRRFNEEGIEIPFPQRTVWMKKEEG